MREILDAALDGVSFNSLDPRLYINDLEEQYKDELETATRPDYGHMILGRQGRSETGVILRFMIKERRPPQRQMIIDQVNAWAASPGWLTLSTRPGKRLYVACTQYANHTALRWGNGLQITLTAYHEAYWQERYPVFAAYTGRSGSVSLAPPGSRACFLEAAIANRSGSTVSAVSFSSGGKTMIFSGLNLPNGKTLEVYYDQYHILHAEVDGVSKLSCRTPESADDVLLQPGRANVITMSATGACAFTLMARGEWA